MDTAQIVRDLKTQEAALQHELGAVQEALAALQKGDAPTTKGALTNAGKKTGRRLSAAGRAAIAKAARLRWKKHRAAQRKAGK